MSVIALTGATGFVGRSLVGQLKRTFPDATLRVLVRDAADRTLPVALETGCQIINGGLESADALERLVCGSDAVIHAAAAIAGNHAESFDRINIVGTRCLLDSIDRQAPNCHLVQISSLAAGKPALSWYAASKRAAEELVSARARRYSIVRPPAVYGPEDPALADFWRWLARGWLIRLGPVNARFSLLHVDDLAGAVAELVAKGPIRRNITLAGDQPPGGWSWEAVGAVAARVRGGKVRIAALPRIALKSVAGLNLLRARTLSRPAILTPGKARELLYPDWVCDNQAAGQMIDWQPTTSLEQALDTLPGWRRQ
ncbi:MAG: NAD(P)-dependent oxidoreductase [Wenzhouxiangellaceae bacterium]|nr:NAD(P)-dependent oxidoreductase [Wenzhouxiangellaceae bacterium]